MKKLMITLIILILIMSGCTPKEPIKVAFVGGISGSLSELGVAARNAFLLKVKEVNDAGGINGREIQALVYDDQNEPDKIPELYGTLREENVEYVVGHILSSLAPSVLEEAAKEDILVVSATMSTNLIDGKDDYLIRSAVSNSFQALRMAQMMNDDGRNHVLVVVDSRNKAYTEEFSSVFQDHFNGSATTVSFAPDDESDKNLYETLSTVNPDALLLITPAIDTAFIAQKSREINPTLPLYGVSWSMSSDLISNGGDAVEGMKIVYTKVNEDYNEIKAAFRERYKAEYSEEAIFVSDIVYEASKLLFESMNATEDATISQVKEQILSREFEGIEDTIVFNEYGDREGEYNIFIVKNKEFILLE